MKNDIKTKRLIEIKKNRERIIGKVLNNLDDQTFIFFAGIHGNEKAGVLAARRVLTQLEKQKDNVQGNVYFIYGNKKALDQEVRYLQEDLNRIWSLNRIEKIKDNIDENNPEEFEQFEIYKAVKDIITKHRGTKYFIDLHTTSSPTQPFITISDSLNNRKFSSCFSVPVILGLEEYLNGPLLTFMNEYGYISLGFEAGEHYSQEAIDNCEAFIWLSLYFGHCLKKKEIIGFDVFDKRLNKSSKNNDFFQIDFRYSIQKDENFKMINGFVNFDEITKDKLLAYSDGKEIRAVNKGLIFMPLYQNLGEDGFFIIHKISKKWLKLSAFLRKYNAHHLLRILPGIQKHPDNPFTLVVNPMIATFMAKEIFHLFGYRQRVLTGKNYHFIKRDRKITPFP
ncbi:succinylglutamate desuccinylase/aspartoacylase domain-containing protein [Namhaeicola litoreus]|uniref:succinylglutamate desuccinylase/aspartoacylase domain-containing protein n=1 Tax=Namhaeicola litoreus TaxID=1052145 RepID=UPI0036705211